MNLNTRSLPTKTFVGKAKKTTLLQFFHQRRRRRIMMLILKPIKYLTAKIKEYLVKYPEPNFQLHTFKWACKSNYTTQSHQLKLASTHTPRMQDGWYVDRETLFHLLLVPLLTMVVNYVLTKCLIYLWCIHTWCLNQCEMKI